MKRRLISTSVITGFTCALVLTVGQAWGAPFLLDFMPGGRGIGFIQGGPVLNPDGHGNKDSNRVITNLATGLPNSSGTTATTSAWSLSHGTWTESQLYGWSGGLGICNQGEGLISPGPRNDTCSGRNGTHSADNRGRKDFFLLEFSKSVDLTSATVTAWGNGIVADYDSSYYSGNGTFDFGNLGPEFESFQSRAAYFGQERTFNLSGTDVDWLLIGANLGHKNDGFKLKNIQFSAVPVPSSVFLLGTGLAGLVGLARRKGLMANKK